MYVVIYTQVIFIWEQNLQILKNGCGYFCVVYCFPLVYHCTYQQDFCLVSVLAGLLTSCCGSPFPTPVSSTPKQWLSRQKVSANRYAAILNCHQGARLYQKSVVYFKKKKNLIKIWTHIFKTAKSPLVPPFRTPSSKTNPFK